MAVILQQASSWQCSRYFPILKKARHGSRVRYFRQKTQVQSSFHPRLFACIRSAFSYRSTTLSTCASMKNSKSSICDYKNGQATTVVRMAAQHTRELIVGRLVWKSSYTRLSETYVHSS